MEMEKKVKFAELLEKRKKLSKAKKEKVVIAAEDSQLLDVLKNFNESKNYKY